MNNLQSYPPVSRDLPHSPHPAPPEPTVLVVDDDASIRRGVSRLVRAAGYSVKTFASPADFLDYELPSGPACVVLDICMDGLTGLEVHDRMRQRDSGRGDAGGERNIPVIFLSGRGTIPVATETIKHGAQDFLEKPIRPKVLLGAIDRAIDHDRSAAGDRLAHEHDRRLYDTLTVREKQVMALVVRGLLNKQSAPELGISEKTIKVHRARVMQKMQVKSLADLVRVAERLGLNPPDPAAAPAAAPLTALDC